MNFHRPDGSIAPPPIMAKPGRRTSMKCAQHFADVRRSGQVFPRSGSGHPVAQGD